MYSMCIYKRILQNTHQMSRWPKLLLRSKISQDSALSHYATMHYATMHFATMTMQQCTMQLSQDCDKDVGDIKSFDSI